METKEITQETQDIKSTTKDTNEDYITCPLCQKKVKRRGIASHFRLQHKIDWRSEFKDLTKLTNYLEQLKKKKGGNLTTGDVLLGSLLGFLGGLIISALTGGRK